MFTVFTPTYNRANTIERTYRSLLHQTFKNFEWLIVNDGSTDDTANLVNKFLEEGKININYIEKPNGGKHTAWNLGVENAIGSFFIILDADDVLFPDALLVVNNYYERIKDDNDIAGITALCSDFQGSIIGDRYPFNSMIGKPAEINSKFGISGDKFGGYKLDILKKYKFPVYRGERFITEGLVINRIAHRYKNIFINEVLCGVEYLEGGLSANSLRLRVNNIQGSHLYYKEAYLFNSYDRKLRVRNLLNYLRFWLHYNAAGYKDKIVVPFFLKVTFMPLAFSLYMKDIWELKK